jgi:UPF0755 protein
LNRKRNKTVRVFIFIVTLLIFVGGLTSVLWLFVGRGSKAGGQPGAVQVDAPSRLEDIVVDAYLNFRQNDLASPAGGNDRVVTFTVQSGESVGQVAGRLQHEGLIRDAELFRLYLRSKGLDSSVEAGEFELNETMSMIDVAQILQRGRSGDEVTLTIPEGQRIEEITQLVSQQLSIDAAELDRLARSPHDFAQFTFLADLPPEATLEGFLFPDTYHFSRQASARDVIERMLATFDHKLSLALRAQLADQGRSLFQAVILASIVEREAVVAAERPAIAGVYNNRLIADMALDADPTVQYAMGYQSEQQTWWNHELTLEDYRAVDSPYNTYLNPGLPPGPICNPGLASILAAIEPDQSPYYFFRAACSGDGTHVFSKTLDEHVARACP